MSKPDRNEISARLRRLPVDFLLALINATAILVIVAAILALIVMVRIDNLAGRVVTTMTEAVLSKIDLPSKNVLANLRNLTEEVRTLGNTLRDIKVGENPVIQMRDCATERGADGPQCERRPPRKYENDPHRRSDWTARPRSHRHTDADEGLRFQGWPNAALSQRQCGRKLGKSSAGHEVAVCRQEPEGHLAASNAGLSTYSDMYAFKLDSDSAQ